MGKRHKDGKREKSHRKAKRRRQEERSRSPGRPPPSGAELHIAAALGERSRCKSLLRAGADVHWTDAELTTPLHAACRHGHSDVAKLLLRHGASAAAPDLRGDTPAHLAARHHHLTTLTLLLQCDRPPALEEANDKGQTVQQAVAAAMAAVQVQAQLKRAHHAAHRAGGDAYDSDYEGGGTLFGGAKPGTAAYSTHPGTSFFGGSTSEPTGGVSPSDWGDRLQEEASDDEAWGAFGGSDWHADEYETPEEYAKRIWQEMQAKRRAEVTAQAAASHKARREQESRRDWARRQSEASSRRTLQEEQAKDADWRAAVAAGAAGAKRASYEARWEFFCTKRGADAPVSFADIPWVLPPAEGRTPSSEGELARVMLYGTETAEERRRRLRTELVRWHPDKWESRWGRALVPQDRQRVLDGVKEMSQVLNAMHAQVQAEAAKAAAEAEAS